MAAIQSHFKVAVPELPDHIDPASYSKLFIKLFCNVVLMVLHSDICIVVQSTISFLHLSVVQLLYSFWRNCATDWFLTLGSLNLHWNHISNTVSFSLFIIILPPRCLYTQVSLSTTEPSFDKCKLLDLPILLNYKHLSTKMVVFPQPDLVITAFRS